ncbi:hypothetical protein RB619_09235 [Flavobacterium sp. LHD-80]|uniref:hypothetical protein n=1 Tax=Flavobacterium sp. LHD-80 TaxID=3071411 RepID=UPI0027DFA724|nr:hypothetical protein [Flavobacterium sp. LHD-80]MDQ6470822.1 hypothetical protein [Flavobacterium sp. LHD-80]
MKSILPFFLIVIILLLSGPAYSQSYEQIKKLDTIYIPFKEGKYNVKINFPVERDGFKNRRYVFNKNKKNVYNFEFKKNASQAFEKQIINKTFLKRYKGKIVKINSLEKFDDQDIQCELFNRSKVFYILDFSENKKGIKYRVIFINMCNVRE